MQPAGKSLDPDGFKRFVEHRMNMPYKVAHDLAMRKELDLARLWREFLLLTNLTPESR